MELHIGNTIKAVAKSKGVSTIDLAKRIPMTRQNLDKIYRKKTVDTELLFLISKALEFNFFRLFSDKFRGKPQTDAINGSEDPEDILDELRKHYLVMEEKFVLQTQVAIYQKEALDSLKEKLKTIEEKAKSDREDYQHVISSKDNQIKKLEELVARLQKEVDKKSASK